MPSPRPMRSGPETFDAELDYYRMHFRPALVATTSSTGVIPRLRTHFTPERVLLARAIEDAAVPRDVVVADV